MSNLAILDQDFFLSITFHHCWQFFYRTFETLKKVLTITPRFSLGFRLVFYISSFREFIYEIATEPLKLSQFFQQKTQTLKRVTQLSLHKQMSLVGKGIKSLVECLTWKWKKKCLLYSLFTFSPHMGDNNNTLQAMSFTNELNNTAF